MNSAYLKIKDIYSLEDILTYLKSVKNPHDVAVFFDWMAIILTDRKICCLQMWYVTPKCNYIWNTLCYF